MQAARKRRLSDPDAHRRNVKESMARLKAQGQSWGTTEYGWTVADDGRTLVPDLLEAEVLEKIYQLRHRDMLSIQAIANHLNDLDVPARGAKWHWNTIWRLLQKMR